MLEKRKGWTKLPNGLIIQWGIAPNHKTQFGCVYEEFAREFEKEAFVGTLEGDGRSTWLISGLNKKGMHICRDGIHMPSLANITYYIVLGL